MKRNIVLMSVLMMAAFGIWEFGDYFFVRVQKRQRVAEERETLAALAKVDAGNVSNAIRAQMRSARTLEEWERMVNGELARLEGKDKESASALARAKLFEARFWTAEYFLVGAGRLLQFDVNHPTAKKYMERARELYEKNESIVHGIKEELGNAEWNAYLNYLKGVYYFRSLLFIKNRGDEQSKIEDLVSQSMVHLRKVFAWLPKDNNTEVTIEILQKKAQEMLNAKGADEQLRLQLKLLPSQEVGPEFSIDGKKEGRY